MSSPITVVGAQQHPTSSTSASAKSGGPPPPSPLRPNHRDEDNKDLPRQVTWNEREDAESSDGVGGGERRFDYGENVEHGGWKKKKNDEEEEPGRRRRCANNENSEGHHVHRAEQTPELSRRRRNDDDEGLNGIASSPSSGTLDCAHDAGNEKANVENSDNGRKRKKKTDEDEADDSHVRARRWHHRPEPGRPNQNGIAPSGVAARDGSSTSTSTSTSASASAADVALAATAAREEAIVATRALAAMRGGNHVPGPAGGGVEVRGRNLGPGKKIVVGLGEGEGESERWLADLCLRRHWRNLGRLVSSRPHLALATFRVMTSVGRGSGEIVGDNRGTSKRGVNTTISSILHEALRDPLGEGDESQWTSDTCDRVSLIRTLLEVELTSAGLRLPRPLAAVTDGNDDIPNSPLPSSTLPIFSALRTDPDSPAHPRTPNAARAEVVRLLLAARARALPRNRPEDEDDEVPLVQPGDRTTLHVAVEEGCDAAVMHVLLNDQGPEDLVERADAEGYLPLHRACCGPGLPPPSQHRGDRRRRPVENPMSALLVVTLLVRKRPSTIHAVTTAGDTPLSLAREALTSLRRGLTEGVDVVDGGERAMVAIVNFLTEASGGMMSGSAAAAAVKLGMPMPRVRLPSQPKFFTSAEEAANAVDVERRRAMAMAAAAQQQHSPLPPTVTATAAMTRSENDPDTSRAHGGMKRPPPDRDGVGNDRKRQRRRAGHQDVGGSNEESTGGCKESVVAAADGTPPPRTSSKKMNDRDDAGVHAGAATIVPAGRMGATDRGNEDARRCALIVGTLKRQHNEVMRGFLRQANRADEWMRSTHRPGGRDFGGVEPRPTRRLPKLPPPSGTGTTDGVVVGGRPPPLAPIPTWEVHEDRVILRYLPSPPQPPPNDATNASRNSLPRSSSLGGDDGSGETSRALSSSPASSGSEQDPNPNAAKTNTMNLNLAEENVRLMDRLVAIEVEHRTTVRGMEMEHDRALLKRSATLRADVRREGERHAADLDRAEEEFRRGFKIGRIMSRKSSVSTEKGGGVGKQGGGENVMAKDETTLRRSRCSTGPDASMARTYRPLL